ncbi:hypothetical protein FOXB_03193, partial [Fusarium oxysporum f. sp. conglutinans Fo5176]
WKLACDTRLSATLAYHSYNISIGGVKRVK